jgi:hypothetical protein
MPSIYNLTASLTMMNCLRVDSHVSNQQEEYNRDKEFFSKHPSRNSHIRHNAPGELDLELPVGQWLKAPALWLHISRVAGETHIVIPVYRGKQFWIEPKTDNNVALILVEMANRQGINVTEWAAFEREVIAAQLEVINKVSTVH